MTKIIRIEVHFAIPVELSFEDQRKLASIVRRITKANKKPGRAHWLYEMEFDGEILYFETAERAAYPLEQPQ